MTDSIVGILLAAGNSSRYGSNKLLEQLPDTGIALALQAANNLLQVLPHCIAVIRDHDEALKQLLSTTDIQICENSHADQGISSSIKAGILALDKMTLTSKKYRGYVIALGDMPFVRPAVIRNVVQGLSDNCLICAPQYNGRRGHPVGFSSELKDELLNLQGDNGAKAIIEKYKTQLRIFDTDTNGILTDIDCPTDLYE